MAIKIDPEFQGLIPPLTDAELAGLEASIVAEGCRDPLVIWQTPDGEITLLDGHNRLRICLANRLPYKTEVLALTDRRTARIWIRENAMSRRNMPMDVKIELGLANAADYAEQARERQGTRTDLHPDLRQTFAESPDDRKTDARVGALAGVSRETVRKYRAVKEKAPEKLEDIREGKTSIHAAHADLIREKRRTEVLKDLECVTVREAKAAEGVYDVIVIDPPWPVRKVERDVRPNQVAELDYPTMEVEEICCLQLPAADSCHVWLWTTQRFLPAALGAIDCWGLKYVCTFVWHKPGGFQPVGLPQYNCEFAIYARCGSPVFTETKDFNLCFDAPRGKHSEKPEAFYDVVRRVTAGRRLDMFNRRKIEGFDGWGKEAPVA